MPASMDACLLFPTPEGEAVGPANFLTLDLHWQAVVRHLAQLTGVAVTPEMDQVGAKIGQTGAKMGQTGAKMAKCHFYIIFLILFCSQKSDRAINAPNAWFGEIW